MNKNSDNAHPKTHALTDDTLRRSGVRDLSDLTEIEADGMRRPPPNQRTDVFEPQIGGHSQYPPRDWELHAGKPPERIDKIHNARNLGLTGKGTNGIFARGEVIRVGHVPASHPNKPVAGNPSIASSDGTYIPSVQIGQPLP